ncbi:MAG: peptidoglycan DD-metalloendopeptidase family protein [Ruminococcus sp.]|nr:peptidoglycan DD-metalloendopeptidase family protein [Ruminococcus sp.]
MKKLKHIACVLLALTLVFSAVVFTSADTISDLEDQQAQLQEEAAQYQAIIDEKQGEIDEQQEYVDALTSNIATVNEEISVIRSKIDVYNSQIAEKAEAINELNLQAEENMNLLRQRLKSIYMAGDASTLEIVLGAKDFSDFVDKVQLVESLSDYDANLIDDIEGQLDGINEEIESLNEDKASLETETSDLEEKQTELNGMLEENEELLRSLYTEREELDALLDSNEASQSEVEQQIQAYYEELRRQEEERQEQEESGGSSQGDGSIPIVGTGEWVWPTPGFWDLSSGWAEDRGYSHGGIDIAGPGIMGATVVAAHSGTVIDVCNYCSHNWGKYGSCGCGGGYGNYVWIDHGDGKATIYAHLTDAVAYVGQTVSAGEVIGYVGSTGYSTGPHLHFEARYYGERYNPMDEYPL